jgi:hypothetical protein
MPQDADVQQLLALHGSLSFRVTESRNHHGLSGAQIPWIKLLIACGITQLSALLLADDALAPTARNFNASIWSPQRFLQRSRYRKCADNHHVMPA